MLYKCMGAVNDGSARLIFLKWSVLVEELVGLDRAG